MSIIALAILLKSVHWLELLVANVFLDVERILLGGLIGKRFSLGNQIVKAAAMGPNIGFVSQVSLLVGFNDFRRSIH